MKVNNFIAASEIMNAKWYDVDELDFMLSNNETSAEAEIIKSEERDILSSEAKFIIQIVMKSGEEIVNKFGKVCKGMITSLMRKKGYTYKEIYSAMAELKEYTKTF